MSRASLLPVLDNLNRALDAEKTVSSHESKSFGIFCTGVELINKQLGDVLESLGIQPIASVGERFDPHIHEPWSLSPRIGTSQTTVTEELARGYRIGIACCGRLW